MRAARWVVLVLCAAGLLRDISLHLWKEHPLRASSERVRPDTRYRWVPPLLPVDEEKVSSLTDSEPGSERTAGRLYDARYALCPRIVAANDTWRFAVAEAGKPSALESIARARGYSLVASHGAVALFERR